MACCLWAITRKYNIGNNLIHVIRTSYTSAVLINGNVGEWFRTREDDVRCVGRTRRNGQYSKTSDSKLRFADDTDDLAGSDNERANLIERLDKTSTVYGSGMETNDETTQLMTNVIKGIHPEIKASDQKIQTVTNCKYLGPILFRYTIHMPIWNDQNISLRYKVR